MAPPFSLSVHVGVRNPKRIENVFVLLFFFLKRVFFLAYAGRCMQVKLGFSRGVNTNRATWFPVVGPTHPVGLLESGSYAYH